MTITDGAFRFVPGVTFIDENSARRQCHAGITNRQHGDGSISQHIDAQLHGQACHERAGMPAEDVGNICSTTRDLPIEGATTGSRWHDFCHETNRRRAVCATQHHATYARGYVLKSDYDST